MDRRRELPGQLFQSSVGAKVLFDAHRFQHRKRQRADEQPARIVEADLAEHGHGQTDGVDLPIALDRSHVLELPVVGLEPAPVLLKECDRIVVSRRRTTAARTQSQPVINLEVGREENPVLMLDEEAADFFGIVPANFRNARRQVSHHVRIFVERLVHPVEVLGVVGEVDANKRRLRITRDYPVERGQQFFV